MIRKIACYLFRAFSFFQVATFTATWLFYGLPRNIRPVIHLQMSKAKNKIYFEK